MSTLRNLLFYLFLFGVFGCSNKVERQPAALQSPKLIRCSVSAGQVLAIGDEGKTLLKEKVFQLPSSQSHELILQNNKGKALLSAFPWRIGKGSYEVTPLAKVLSHHLDQKEKLSLLILEIEKKKSYQLKCQRY